MSADQPEHRRPILRVISGSPTDDELAAILAIVARAAPAPQAPAQVSLWSDPSRGLLSTPRPSATAWRASAMPN